MKQAVGRAGALAIAVLYAVSGGGIQTRAHERHAQVSPRTEVGPFGRGAGTAAQAYLEAEPPLWEGLGALGYRVSTAEPQAQAYFDQGLRLAYGFNHAEARRSFRKAQQIDPNCAMCFWGEAYVLGPNINAPMEPAATAAALRAIGRARQNAVRAATHERALIEALARRYSSNQAVPRAILDEAYAQAMRQTASRFPDDVDIAVLYADALMNQSPWDYWADAGRTPKGRTSELVSALERVLAARPDHIGAIHLYIHAVEASDRPERAIPHAERLAALAPAAGHLVHMPSHAFFRVGRYLDALAANKAAVAADEAFIAAARPSGIYPDAYYPHNIHFLMASAQMAGDADAALESAAKLAAAVSDQAARSVPWVNPMKAAPYYVHAQFSPLARVRALPDPGNRFVLVKMAWHYAQGVTHALAGDTAEARRHLLGLVALERGAVLQNLVAGGIPAPDIIKIARLIVTARIAQAGQDYAGAVQELEEAVAVEDSLPYTEPPHWYYPVRQTLGAALLQSGQAEKAEAAFAESLRRAPNSGWSLYGLALARRARGDAAGAAAALERLDRAWAGERALLDLGRL